MHEELPAWSLPATAAAGIVAQHTWPADVTREWAWGGSTGAGVKVCILDSGIEADHPSVGGVTSAVVVTADADGNPESRRGRRGRRLRPRHRVRGHHPLARPGRASCTRSASSAPRTPGAARRSSPGFSMRSSSAST